MESLIGTPRVNATTENKTILADCAVFQQMNSLRTLLWREEHFSALDAPCGPSAGPETAACLNAAPFAVEPGVLHLPEWHLQYSFK
jgi:hypothetical protein